MAAEGVGRVPSEGRAFVAACCTVDNAKRRRDGSRRLPLDSRPAPEEESSVRRRGWRRSNAARPNLEKRRHDNSGRREY